MLDHKLKTFELDYYCCYSQEREPKNKMPVLLTTLHMRCPINNIQSIQCLRVNRYADIFF